MRLFLIISVLLIGLFICIVNMIYRKIECKNYSTWKKNSIFNSPKAWAIYAACILIVMCGILIYSFSSILLGISNFGKEQDTIQNTITQQRSTSDTSTGEDTSTQQQNKSSNK